MAEINGTFVTEIDGIQFYTDGIIHSGGSINVNIAYIDFSREWDNITDTGSWQIGASTGFPIVNVDSDGNVRVGGDAKAFDVGIIRYADGTIGLYGGLSVGGPLLGLSYSLNAGGGSSSNNLASYDFYSVAADGTTQLVEHFPGDEQYPYVKVKISQLDESGNVVGNPIVTNIGDSELAADMAAGIAPHIYDERGYWGLDQCFLASTPILMSDGSEKSIEEIQPGDMVKSYDKDGKLVAGRVKQTFVKEVEHVLDFFGTGVTPGHVYYCGAGKFKGQHVPLIDILRDDGGVVAADGTLIRAATGMPIGSENDVKMVWAVRGTKTSSGAFQVSERKKIRLSTRVITEAGSDLSVADILKGVEAYVNKNAMIQVDQNSDTEMPFLWTFSESIPKPEDYVLLRSGLTLAEVQNPGELDGVATI